jgi:hypothetical protein
VVSDSLLSSALAAAVPLWIAELKGESWDTIQQLARDSAQLVAEKGDLLMYRSKKRGESAAIFDALARGLACLAFCPAGVRFLGNHWQAKLEGT